MNYDEFKRLFAELMTEKGGTGFRVCFTSVQRNNGAGKDAVTLVSGPGELSPVIRMEDIFLKYRDGESMEALADTVFDRLLRAKRMAGGTVPELTDYEMVRDRIYCRLIGRAENRELLETVPFEEWMDLAVTCYLQIEGCGIEGSAQVTKELVKLWGVSEPEVMEKAWENTIDRKDPVFRNLGSVIREMQISEGSGVPFPEGDSELYLLSNRERRFGAVCIAYPLIPFFIEKTLQAPAFFILPSSIHECLILPDKGQFSREELDALIRRVNETEVDPGEVLSDHVYYYADGHVQSI